MAIRSSMALAAISARSLAQSDAPPSPETKIACITGDVPEGASASTITATKFLNGNSTSYINTDGLCDANTLFMGAQATEWTGAPPSTTPSDPSDLSQWNFPSYSTEYVKVVVSTLYGNGTVMTTPTSLPWLGVTGTGSSLLSESTSEAVAPYGNGTTTQSSSSAISTSTSSGPCGGTEGSNFRGPNGEIYEVRSGADSSINSYSGTDATTIQNCFSLCNSESKCKGFTYVTSGEAAGICYLKSETGEFVSGVNTINMCSAFQVLSSSNGTISSLPSGSVVPTPGTSGAPFQNSTGGAASSSVPFNTAATGSVNTAFTGSLNTAATGSSSVASNAPFQNSTAGNTAATTSSVSLNTAATGSSSASSNVLAQNSTIVDPASASSSASERTIVTTQTVTNTDVQTQTVSLGNGTTTAYLTATHTSEVPRTITVVGPVVTTTHLLPVTEVITRHNGTTTFVHTEKIPYTTTVDKSVYHTHTQNHTQVVTSVETKYLTLTKIGSNGTTTLVKTSLVPHTKTVTPPVSYITRTLYTPTTVTEPCTKKSCRKSATASVTSHKITLVEPVTASCTTVPAVVEVKTSTIRTVRSNSTITTTSCDTYTRPATTKWTYSVPCDTTSTSLRSANTTSKISSTTPVSPNNSTRASTTPCDTSSSAIPVSPMMSANTTSSQRFTPSTVFTTSIKTVSRMNSTSLETCTVVAYTTLVPVPNTPVGPTNVPQTSAPGSSPVASVSQPSAPGSSPVAPASPSVVPGSSPASPAAPDTTQTTHTTTTSRKTVDVTVTETRPGESPISPTQPEQPSAPVSPEQPSTPVSPEQPSVPVSPEQPSASVSPEQPSVPVSPEQPSKPASPEQPILKPGTTYSITYSGALYPTETPTPTTPGPKSESISFQSSIDNRKTNTILLTATPAPAAGAAGEVSANIVASGLVAVVAAVMMAL
ncbi:hypothetical protein MBLNU13_g02510t1 [Cladosporium sp. NU13]